MTDISDTKQHSDTNTAACAAYGCNRKAKRRHHCRRHGPDAHVVFDWKVVGLNRWRAKHFRGYRKVSWSSGRLTLGIGQWTPWIQFVPQAWRNR